MKLMEAFMYRFHPRTEKVIELVQGGAVGALRMIRSAFTFRLTQPTTSASSRSWAGARSWTWDATAST